MDKLKFISEQMNILGIPYDFIDWKSDFADPYWIGEYTESPSINEDGSAETSFILTGTTRGEWLSLEEAKERIRHHFPAVGGLCDKTEGGAIAVFFAGSFPVPTGDAALKRIQINLDIKEWKGAI